MVRNRRLIELKHDEGLDLLASVRMGRVVFNERSLPAIRLVTHLFEQGEILIRTWLTSETLAEFTARASPGIVVAYEADEFDWTTETGWSVVVVGTALPVEDPERLARIGRELNPWINGPRNTAIAISPTIVTGQRIIAEEV